MKNSFKYILSAASFLFMAAGVSFADEDNTLQAHKSVVANPNVGENGGYTLTLEAWATGEEVKTTVEIAKPLDIVLVLDVSGSMEEEKMTETTTKQEYQQTKDDISTVFSSYTKKNYYVKNNNSYTKITRVTRGTYNKYRYYINGSNSYVSDSKTVYELVEVTTTTTTDVTRMTALQSAVVSFINTISQKANSQNVDHRVSIVKFASESTDSIGDDTYYDSNYRYYPNYSQIVMDLTSADDPSTLINAVNSLSAMGATRSDLGLEHAVKVVKGIDEERKAESNQIVIMFTDGKPTSIRDFNTNVANDAVSNAQLLKNAGATVYTIGVFSPSDISDSKILQYMNAVSSNVKSASSYTSGSDTISGFFMVASDANSLNSIFETISNAIGDAETTTLTATNSSVRDYVTPEFKIVEGETTGAARLYTVAVNSSTGNFDYETKELVSGKKNEAGEPYQVIFDGKKDGKSEVVIRGFDFAANWVGERTLDGVSQGYQGKKLIIEIDIELDPDFANAGGVIATNTDQSGIYKGDNEQPESQFTWAGVGFEVPQAVNPGDAYLHIVNNFLGEDAGPQSAVFEIKDEAGILYNVMLTDSNNEAFVKVNWLNLGDNDTVDSENLGDKMKSFTVTEKGWSMNGISRADSSVNTLYKWDADDKKWVENVFIFNSSATESEVEHDETYVLDVK